MTTRSDERRVIVRLVVRKVAFTTRARVVPASRSVAVSSRRSLGVFLVPAREGLLLEGSTETFELVLLRLEAHALRRELLPLFQQLDHRHVAFQRLSLHLPLRRLALDELLGEIGDVRLELRERLVALRDDPLEAIELVRVAGQLLQVPLALLLPLLQFSRELVVKRHRFGEPGFQQLLLQVERIFSLCVGLLLEIAPRHELLQVVPQGVVLLEEVVSDGCGLLDALADRAQPLIELGLEVLAKFELGLLALAE
mmetsp:Transcript_15982/g.62200  ORF Transcript_15982/g.62200 Transcript_15982/m.62200 type:complete len:254 (+) Transcript_15982:839-1600(+)